MTSTFDPGAEFDRQARMKTGKGNPHTWLGMASAAERLGPT
ncbi:MULTISPECIES: hypothetical protein [Kitasatospora]